MASRPGARAHCMCVHVCSAQAPPDADWVCSIYTVVLCYCVAVFNNSLHDCTSLNTAGCLLVVGGTVGDLGGRIWVGG